MSFSHPFCNSVAFYSLCSLHNFDQHLSSSDKACDSNTHRDHLVWRTSHMTRETPLLDWCWQHLTNRFMWTCRGNPGVNELITSLFTCFTLYLHMFLICVIYFLTFLNFNHTFLFIHQFIFNTYIFFKNKVILIQFRKILWMTVE